MRRRKFTFRTSEDALPYITHLLENDIAFSVAPYTNRVEVITPFELKPEDFPDPESTISNA